ncbi:hypothetical protein [Sphingobacterium multivorum]|uniref:hypothetical protein n=1 Tax=Sphingobacterium multivorum TaxID=28454 RepID=UPI003DA464C0
MKKLIKSIFSQRRKEGASQTRLGMFAERCQQRCADWLNNKIARLSVTTIVVSMSIFLMGGGTFFVFVMFRSLMYLDEGMPAIETGGRSETPYGSSTRIFDTSVLSREEIRLLKEYRSHIDSVSRTDSYRNYMDSRDTIIKNNHSNLKKK